MPDGNSGGPGGFGQPGERRSRIETVREEIKRILVTVRWMIIYGAAVLVFLFGDLILLGPLVGLLVGYIIVIALGTYASREVFLSDERPLVRLIPLGSLGLALILWSYFGWELVSRLWPPVRLAWPLWVKALLEGFSLIVKFACGWGMWGMWGELVDPGGPTAPRAATPRDKMITPFSKETYAGKVVPEEREELPQVQERVIRVEVPDQQGNERRAFLPDIAGLPGFARAASNGQPFNEGTAKRFRIGRDHWQVIRDQSLARGWLEWRDPNAHRQGLQLTRVGRAVFRHLGGVRSSSVTSFAPAENARTNEVAG
jgi:hypothetical protein